ncbi:unnamed protein product [Nyctereutes procyonoides]|uniref:(raccoon dog) hypothetical protein n=1 Tax=Nyctereutes procyonoides TaxID=34880 RepID=A0A811ZH38_NYCPR|nr:unnamed protein product [Nyctereutes procyonoides]
MKVAECIGMQWSISVDMMRVLLVWQCLDDGPVSTSFGSQAPGPPGRPGPGDPRGASGRSWPGRRDSRPTPADSGRGPAPGFAGAPRPPLTHREALVADAAHGEAVVPGVHGPGQDLVQVHVRASVQQRTPRPAHAPVGSAAASLPPSLRGGGRSWAATAAAPGARSRSRSAGARSSSRAPAAEARRGRAAERAQRGASRAPVTARAGPGEAPGRLKGRRPRLTPRGRAAPSARFLRARGGRPSPSLSGAGSTRARLPRPTCPFPAPVPATPTGLRRSLRVARSPRPKYRETSRGGEGYCGKGLTSLPQFTDQQV